MAEIVLVDDDANILASVRIALEADGFRVRSYTDGHSALAALEAQPADIGVFDINAAHGRVGTAEKIAPKQQNACCFSYSRMMRLTKSSV